MLKGTMKTSIGGYCGESNVCILHRMRIGGYEIEKIVALAVPFDGELKDHILLGANVTNNWKFTLSRLENKMDVVEQFSDETRLREYPYRYCFDNRGKIIGFQEIDV
jgi:hypothetical protein